MRIVIVQTPERNGVLGADSPGKIRAAPQVDSCGKKAEPGAVRGSVGHLRGLPQLDRARSQCSVIREPRDFFYTTRYSSK